MPYRKLISPNDLERETGHGKDLLRKWRERYGFPMPFQDETGEWGYTREQIIQLRLIMRLQDAGFRPSQIVGKPVEELERFSKLVSPRECELEMSQAVRKALDMLKANQLNRLDALLEQESRSRTLSDFVIQVVAPLTVAVGNAWAARTLAVYQEHLCSSLLVRRLHVELATKQKLGGGSPRILFATLSDESHILGLLMAQAVLADHGADCINIGANTPTTELVDAAGACQADILAVSFSFAYPRRRVLPDLKYLRAELSASVEIWAGGAGVISIRRHPKGIRLFGNLESAIAALRERKGRAHGNSNT